MFQCCVLERALGDEHHSESCEHPFPGGLGFLKQIIWCNVIHCLGKQFALQGDFVSQGITQCDKVYGPHTGPNESLWVQSAITSYTCNRCQAPREELKWLNLAQLGPDREEQISGSHATERSVVRARELSGTGTAGRQGLPGGRYVCNKQPKAVGKERQDVTPPRILRADEQDFLGEDAC